ncbi:MAG: hypothetical protein EOP19_29600 [Hyphomicrobiales bacterium]|nr:MAG: hypothetical protein EOP19_29600 [Hyphomicrobiales bacterium]
MASWRCSASGSSPESSSAGATTTGTTSPTRHTPRCMPAKIWMPMAAGRATRITATTTVRAAPHDGHGQHAHHVVLPNQVKGDWREQLGVVVGVGLRPCSGALVVLVFALSQGLLAAGIVAVLLMGLGTAITVAILASLAVGAKGVARRLLGSQGNLASGVIWWAELLGALLVFAFGVILLLASL